MFIQPTYMNIHMVLYMFIWNIKLGVPNTINNNTFKQRHLYGTTSRNWTVQILARGKLQQHGALGWIVVLWHTNTSAWFAFFSVVEATKGGFNIIEVIETS